MNDKIRRVQRCDPVFKELFMGHSACDLKTRPIFVSGFRLKLLLKKTNSCCTATELENHQQYQVCYTVKKKLKALQIPEENLPAVGEDGVDEDDAEEEGGDAEEEDEDAGEEDGVASVRNKKKRMQDDVEADVEEEDHPSKRKMRTSSKEKLLNDIFEAGKLFRQPYRRLCNRERTRRINTLANSVIATCVSKSDLKDKGVNSLVDNVDLAVDIISVLDAMKDRMQKVTKVNFNSLEAEVTLETTPDSSSVIHPLQSLQEAILLLSVCTKTTYTLLRKKFIKGWNISKESLPSYHMMTKHRPKMVPFEIDLRANNTSYQDWTTTSAIDINSSSLTTRIFPR